MTRVKIRRKESNSRAERWALEEGARMAEEKSEQMGSTITYYCMYVWLRLVQWVDAVLIAQVEPVPGE